MPISREDRLAAALRVNLKRRKAAEKAKAASSATPPPLPTDPEDKP
jgi:hypothetical protein